MAARDPSHRRPSPPTRFLGMAVFATLAVVAAWALLRSGPDRLDAARPVVTHDDESSIVAGPGSAPGSSTPDGSAATKPGSTTAAGGHGEPDSSVNTTGQDPNGTGSTTGTGTGDTSEAEQLGVELIKLEAEAEVTAIQLENLRAEAEALSDAAAVDQRLADEAQARADEAARAGASPDEQAALKDAAKKAGAQATATLDAATAAGRQRDDAALLHKQISDNRSTTLNALTQLGVQCQDSSTTTSASSSDTTTTRGSHAACQSQSGITPSGHNHIPGALCGAVPVPVSGPHDNPGWLEMSNISNVGGVVGMSSCGQGANPKGELPDLLRNLQRKTISDNTVVFPAADLAGVLTLAESQHLTIVPGPDLDASRFGSPVKLLVGMGVPQLITPELAVASPDDMADLSLDQRMSLPAPTLEVMGDGYLKGISLKGLERMSGAQIQTIDTTTLRQAKVTELSAVTGLLSLEQRKEMNFAQPELPLPVSPGGSGIGRNSGGGTP